MLTQPDLLTQQLFDRRDGKQVAPLARKRGSAILGLHEPGDVILGNASQPTRLSPRRLKDASGVRVEQFGL